MADSSVHGSGRELVPVGKKPVGRPKGSGCLYTDEIADEICERMAGGETLIKVCREHRDGRSREPGEGFPTAGTVWYWADPTWRAHIPSFIEPFARARILQQRFWIEETIDIADTPEPGIEEVYEHSSKNGVSLKRSRKDMLGHRVLKIETRHKAIARMNPQMWEARLQQATTPELPDGSTPGETFVVKGGLPDDVP